MYKLILGIPILYTVLVVGLLALLIFVIHALFKAQFKISRYFFEILFTDIMIFCIVVWLIYHFLHSGGLSFA